ncbi:MAG: hypothetical protein HZT41_10015 [Dechloromonas sp.]|nr:MAG: hypothetical protein HZT41_10015 [Dechloromonas sp.]
MLPFQGFEFRILGAQEVVAQQDDDDGQKAQDGAGRKTGETAEWAAHGRGLIGLAGWQDESDESL